jgi:hypothetical protein
MYIENLEYFLEEIGSVVLFEVGQSEKNVYFGKEGMHKRSDRWKEEKHVCIHGRPNEVRVRVFTINFNGW